MGRLKNLTIELAAQLGNVTDAQQQAAAIFADERRQKATEYGRMRRRKAGAMVRKPRPSTPLKERTQALGWTPIELAKKIGRTPQAVRIALAGCGMPGVVAEIEALVAAFEGAQ